MFGDASCILFNQIRYKSHDRWQAEEPPFKITIHAIINVSKIEVVGYYNWTTYSGVFDSLIRILVYRVSNMYEFLISNQSLWPEDHRNLHCMKICWVVQCCRADDFVGGLGLQNSDTLSKTTYVRLTAGYIDPNLITKSNNIMGTLETLGHKLITCLIHSR